MGLGMKPDGSLSNLQTQKNKALIVTEHLSGGKRDPVKTRFKKKKKS